MTDKQDLIREIHEYVAAHGGENTATHLLVQAASAIQTQAAELEAVGAGGVQALSAAPAGPWSLGEMTGNWRDIDLPDHGAVMRIVWKMEDDEGRNEELEAQAHAVVAALNAAFSSPPAEQPIGELVVTKTKDGQIVSVTRQDDEGRILSVIATSDTEEQQATATDGYVQPVPDKCDRITWRGRYYHLPLTEQVAPKAAPGEPSDWKPLKTSKEGRDAVRSFFREKLKRHDFDAYIMGTLAADFACALGGYLEAAPQQEAQEAQEPATVPYQKLTNEIDLILTDPNTVLSFGARRALHWMRTWVSVPLYTAPQPAPAPLSDDTKRLAWVADGWTPGHEKLYAQHVLETGGVGDLDDLRTFIDKQIAARGGKA